MPIWLQLAAYASFLACLAHAGRDRVALTGLLSVVGMLFLVQLWKFAGFGEGIWVAFFVSWVAVAGLWARISRLKNLHAVTTCLMLVSVSLCYLWGRVAGQPFGPDAFQLILADGLGVAAWSIMAGPSVGVLVRNTSLAWRRGGSGNRAGSHLARGKAEQ